MGNKHEIKNKIRMTGLLVGNFEKNCLKGTRISISGCAQINFFS